MPPIAPQKEYRLIRSNSLAILLPLILLNPILFYLLSNTSNADNFGLFFLIPILSSISGIIFGLLPIEKNGRILYLSVITITSTILSLFVLLFNITYPVRNISSEIWFTIVSNFFIFFGFLLARIMYATLNKLFPRLYPYILLKLPLFNLVAMGIILFILKFVIDGDFFNIAPPIFITVAITLSIYRYYNRIPTAI